MGKNNNNGRLLLIFLLPLFDFEELDFEEVEIPGGRGEPIAPDVASCKNASSASATVTNSFQRVSAAGPQASNAPAGSTSAGWDFESTVSVCDFDARRE